MRQTIRTLALLAAVLLIVGACASTAVHPGAASKFDSQTYDTLITAQAAIEEARAQAWTDPRAKEILNAVIATYNTALDGYLIYHQAAAASARNGGALPDSAALAAQVVQLLADVGELRKLLPSRGGGH